MKRQKIVGLVRLCCIVFGLQTTVIYAQPNGANCQQLYKEIRQSQKARQHQRQLEKIKIAADVDCLKNAKASSQENGRSITRVILNRWSAEILSQVIPKGEKARFDDQQIKHLQQYKSDIAAMQSYVQSKRENWLPALLDVVLNKPNTPQQFSQILQPIFEGYIEDSKNNLLPKVVIDSRLVEFIRLLDQGLSLKNMGEETFASRSFGDPPQIAIMKIREREEVSNSSTEDVEPNSINTPIRFKFDSTELSQRGEQEYKIMLKVLTSDLIKSVFLIGHSSPQGSAKFNCALSKRRVQALKQRLIQDTNIPADKISIAWAGENIPLNFGQANDFIKEIEDDHVFTSGKDKEPMRRRVEIELNGELLKQRYAGQFCQD